MSIDESATPWETTGVDGVVFDPLLTLLPGVARLLKERNEACAKARAAAQATAQAT